MSEIGIKEPKPKWWLPYWLIQIVLAVVFWVTGYLLLNLTLLITSVGLTATLVFIGVLYFIRIKQPNWLKPYWIALTVSALAIAIVSYVYVNAPLERVVAAAVLTLFSISLGYYIRVRPNVKVNRAMYVGLGVVVIGFVFWFILMLTLNVTGARWSLESRFLERNIPSGILAFITMMLCYVAGGYVGDWIGKRRDYQLPLYP